MAEQLQEKFSKGTDEKIGLVFVHGLTEKPDFWAREWVSHALKKAEGDEAKRLNIEFRFPSAPKRSIEGLPDGWNGEKLIPGWFDLAGLPIVPDMKTYPADYAISVATIHEEIDQLRAEGFPADRIFLGGFSRGGAMTILSGLSYPEKLGGLIVFSGWLLLEDESFDNIYLKHKDVPMLWWHGDDDNIVTTQMQKRGVELLKEKGVESIVVKTKPEENKIMDLGLPDAGHTGEPRQFDFALEWMREKVGERQKATESMRGMKEVGEKAKDGEKVGLVFVHGLTEKPDFWAREWVSHALKNAENADAKTLNIEFRFPTAPRRAIEGLPDGWKGEKFIPGWFDLAGLPVVPDMKTYPADYAVSVARIHEEIDALRAASIPADRIFLGGFSQGGAMTILSGLSYPEKLGGLIVFSGWLLLEDDSFDATYLKHKDVPMLWWHGDGDQIVTTQMQKRGAELLKDKGVESIVVKTEPEENKVRDLGLPNANHTGEPRQFEFALQWVSEKVADPNEPVAGPDSLNSQQDESPTQLEAVARADPVAVLIPDKLKTQQGESATQMEASARADPQTDGQTSKTVIDSGVAIEQHLKGGIAMTNRDEQGHAAIEIDGDERGLPIHIAVGGNVSIGCCRLGCWV